MRLFRLLKIASVASRFGLDEMVLEHEPSGRLVRIANALQFWRDLSAPRAERLRLALESSARSSSSSARCCPPGAT
jgi:ubiquinone biosynthesis protein